MKPITDMDIVTNFIALNLIADMEFQFCLFFSYFITYTKRREIHEKCHFYNLRFQIKYKINVIDKIILMNGLFLIAGKKVFLDLIEATLNLFLSKTNQFKVKHLLYGDKLNNRLILLLSLTFAYLSTNAVKNRNICEGLKVQ